jgi:hypothetical protein
MHSSRYTYGDFLRAMRDQPGSRWKLVAFVAVTASLGRSNGTEYALIVAGASLAGVLTLGYPAWRWIARRRGRPF